MDDVRWRLERGRVFSAKTSRSGYRQIILSISACWHLLARQDEATDMLLANWAPTQIPRTAQ